MSVDIVNHASRPLHQNLDTEEDHLRSWAQGSIFVNVVVDLSTLAVSAVDVGPVAAASRGVSFVSQQNPKDFALNTKHHLSSILLPAICVFRHLSHNSCLTILLWQTDRYPLCPLLDPWSHRQTRTRYRNPNHCRRTFLTGLRGLRRERGGA